MSYTVVIDEREREQRFENRLNALYRRCRIGRVSRKMQTLGGMVPRPFPPKPVKPISWPHEGTPLPMPQYPYADVPPSQYMSKCGCKVGSACNNVACPYRLVATC